jgi:hypothetical protein
MKCAGRLMIRGGPFAFGGYRSRSSAHARREVRDLEWSLSSLPVRSSRLRFVKVPMNHNPCRSTSLGIALVMFAGCADAGRSLQGSLGVVEVIETPPPIAVEPVPLLVALPLVPVEINLEPLPLPARHVVLASTVPAGSSRLSLVQSVEVDVEVEGGAYGAREISAVFVSPQGLVWEKQGEVIDGKRGEKQRAHFSLPIASTFIEEQQLFGTWRVNTLDDGVELATTTFAVSP